MIVMSSLTKVPQLKPASGVHRVRGSIRFAMPCAGWPLVMAKGTPGAAAWARSVSTLPLVRSVPPTSASNEIFDARGSSSFLRFLKVRILLQPFLRRPYIGISNRPWKIAMITFRCVVTNSRKDIDFSRAAIRWRLGVRPWRYAAGARRCAMGRRRRSARRFVFARNLIEAINRVTRRAFPRLRPGDGGLLV